MKSKIQISFIMEIFWLIVLILSAAKGIQLFITKGFTASQFFFIISVLSLLLFLLRRNLRKKENNPTK
jgi:positive regulator of sigma E activity